MLLTWVSVPPVMVCSLSTGVAAPNDDGYGAAWATAAADTANSRDATSAAYGVYIRIAILLEVGNPLGKHGTRRARPVPSSLDEPSVTARRRRSGWPGR